MTTDERVSKLESRLDDLRTSETDLRGQLRQARLDHWQDRIDDLELQVHLGFLDGGDRLSQARATLQSTWDRAYLQMQDTSADATAAAKGVQAGLRGAYDDVRAALVDAKTTMSR